MAPNTVHTTAFYQFSSPRYHSIKNYETILVPEKYLTYDEINGTFDKFFPCYSLDTSDSPKVMLTNHLSQASALKGDLALTVFRDQYLGKEVGRDKNPDQPSNSNLDFKAVFQTEHSMVKINPGWCVIQEVLTPGASNPTYSAQYLVRALGNNAVCQYIHSIELKKPSRGTRPLGSFLPGTIVSYQGTVWKALVQTQDFPPEKVPSNPQDPILQVWRSISYPTNVFNADVFALSEAGSKYMTEVSDDQRQFNPNTAGDNLVVYNVAYHHS